jgi:hypothetical protein
MPKPLVGENGCGTPPRCWPSPTRRSTPTIAWSRGTRLPSTWSIRRATALPASAPRSPAAPPKPSGSSSVSRTRRPTPTSPQRWRIGRVKGSSRTSSVARVHHGTNRGRPCGARQRPRIAQRLALPRSPALLGKPADGLAGRIAGRRCVSIFMKPPHLPRGRHASWDAPDDRRPTGSPHYLGAVP